LSEIHNIIISYGWIAILLIFVVLLILVLLKRVKDQRPIYVDEMEGHDFEYYCADLLKEMGYEDVEVTKGSGDYGVDILAVKDNITYAFQCKCYDRPIGVKAVQEVYAGRDYYDRMIGVVITNQYFTEPAIKLASKLKIILWDRDFIKEFQ
jgi:restriction system protein